MRPPNLRNVSFPAWPRNFPPPLPPTVAARAQTCGKSTSLHHLQHRVEQSDSAGYVYCVAPLLFSSCFCSPSTVETRGSHLGMACGTVRPGTWLGVSVCHLLGPPLCQGEIPGRHTHNVLQLYSLGEARDWPPRNPPFPPSYYSHVSSACGSPTHPPPPTPSRPASDPVRERQSRQFGHRHTTTPK